MSELITESLYCQISDKLLKEIDLSKLPLYGEYEYYKMTVERYGKVKIKLDIEKDIDKIKYVESLNSKRLSSQNYYTYEWEVEEKKLPKVYEPLIRPEIMRFIEIFSIFNKNKNVILKFSVVDGNYKTSEKYAYELAVRYALIELFNQV